MTTNFRKTVTLVLFMVVLFAAVGFSACNTQTEPRNLYCFFLRSIRVISITDTEGSNPFRGEKDELEYIRMNVRSSYGDSSCSCEIDKSVVAGNKIYISGYAYASKEGKISISISIEENDHFILGSKTETYSGSYTVEEGYRPPSMMYIDCTTGSGRIEVCLEVEEV